MRVTDVFLSIPPLVLALAILGFLRPSLTNAMIAVVGMWWPWYARLTYNVTRQVATEGYVAAAEVVGASTAAHRVPRDPAELRGADRDQDDARPRLRDPARLEPQLPRARRAAAHRPTWARWSPKGPSTCPDLWWLAVFPGLAILLVGARLQPDGRRRVNDLMDVER